VKRWDERRRGTVRIIHEPTEVALGEILGVAKGWDDYGRMISGGSTQSQALAL
jgi:hypothetical protein